MTVNWKGSYEDESLGTILSEFVEFVHIQDRKDATNRLSEPLLPPQQVLEPLLLSRTDAYDEHATPAADFHARILAMRAYLDETWCST